MQHWLIKTEPTTLSINDLAKAPKQTTSWEGVRNYQARNFLRAMKQGDLAIVYHSNAAPPAAVTPKLCPSDSQKFGSPKAGPTIGLPSGV